MPDLTMPSRSENPTPSAPRRVRARRLSRVLAGCALVLLAGAGCRSFQVRTDFDETRSFDAISTFYFVEPPEAEPGAADPFADNDLLRKRVRQTIESELVDRGWRLVEDRSRADLLVTYRVLLEEAMRADGFSTAPGFGYYRAGLGATVQTTTRVRSFQESTLMIDVLDPENEELVWRGWGEGMLSTRDRVRDSERLADGVRAIFAKFPPK